MQNSKASMFFYVINHFKPENSGPHLAASTLFAASLAVQAPQVATVIVVDGSKNPDPELSSRLTAINVGYVHEGRQMTFAEGYNAGLARSDQPWTILSASDVYPNLEMFAAFEKICKSADPSIGCVIPALNNTDLDFQRHRVASRLGPIDIPLMTLNLNAFPTAYLREIGGVSEIFSGNYNDVVLADRFRDDRRRIILADANCVHFGTLTLSSGNTGVSKERDKAKFIEIFPQYYLEGAPWDLNLGSFSRDWRLKLLFQALRFLPMRLRRRVGTIGTRLIIRPFR